MLLGHLPDGAMEGLLQKAFLLDPPAFLIRTDFHQTFLAVITLLGPGWGAEALVLARAHLNMTRGGCNTTVRGLRR